MFLFSWLTKLMSRLSPPADVRCTRRSSRPRLSPVASVERLEPRAMLTIAYQTYGLDVSPYIDAGENPNNGPGQITVQELRDRLTPLAEYTEWFRTFSPTGDLQLASQIIHDELGKKAAIGAWIGPNEASNQAQIDALVDQAINHHVDLAIVGSEALLRGDVSSSTLVGYINDVKTRLAAANVFIPVTTADVYNQLLSHPDVVNAVDVVFANYYPFWEGSSVNTAVATLHRQHQQLKVMAAAKEVIVSETGWPSDGETKGDAVPSPENAAYYFENFVSWARAENEKYFYFESFDEAWKGNEGELGKHWGLFDANLAIKPGMERVFNGETLPDNWTNPPGPPIIDFFAMPNTIDTNLGTFVVAGTTYHTDDVVKLNGNVIPAGAKDASGVFTFTVPLVSGQNSLALTIESATGQVLRAGTKTVNYDSSLSTSGRRLLYVDAVVGESSDLPYLDGTVVIDPDQNTVLGLIPGKHVRGISPNVTEIYMDDNSVFSTGSHQQIRMLPFSQSILSNGFVVSPAGDRLYSRNEVVNVQTNLLEPPLPVDITTGTSFASASIPGGPGISADGTKIYANRPIVEIDTNTRTSTPTNVSGTGNFLSDIAVSPDGSQLLVSSYYKLDIYDTTSNPAFQLTSTLNTADFAGEIGFVGDGTKAVVGASGNPSNGGGGVSLVDLTTQTIIDSFAIPLADNLTTSGNEVFVSTGDSESLSGKRLGVDVLVVGQDGTLALTETIFLGINQFARTSGRPQNDQIRRIVFKPEIPVELVGTTLNVYGTPQADTITVTEGVNLTITRNGVSFVYSPAQVTVINIHGKGGNDTLSFTGTAGNETATLRPGMLDLTGSGYAAHADSVETVRVYGGGGTNDVANLYDSAGNDTFTGRTDYSVLAGAGFYNYANGFDKVYANATSGDAGGLGDRAFLYDSVGNDTFTGRPDYSLLMGVGFYNHVTSFDKVYANATAGDAGGLGDRAFLYDSVGNDTFTGRPTFSLLTGVGFYNYVTSFDKVYANATAGDAGGLGDRAFLYDSVGNDTFTGWPDYSLLTGVGFYNYVTSFDKVYAYATAGDAGGLGDQAFLYDSVGNDTLTGTPTFSLLTGVGFYNYVTSFDKVYAYATAGDAGGLGDRAFLYDSVGNDTFTGRTDYSLLTGVGFYNYVTSFDKVYANATAGDAGGLGDRAFLYDSVGNDTFTGRPDYSLLTGVGFYNYVTSFDKVYANATAGDAGGLGDRAFLYDSVGNDTFTGRPDYSLLMGVTFYNYVTSFDKVYANATAGDAGGLGDRAFLYDSVGNDTFTGRPDYSLLTGMGFYNYVTSFDKVYAYATAGDAGGVGDRAYLYDSAANDTFYGRSNYGWLTGPGFYNYVIGFDSVYAYANAGGMDTLNVSALGYAFQRFGSWEQIV